MKNKRISGGAAGNSAAPPFLSSQPPFSMRSSGTRASSRHRDRGLLFISPCISIADG